MGDRLGMLISILGVIRDYLVIMMKTVRVIAKKKILKGKYISQQ